MPYIEKVTRAGRTVLYERSYSSHIHPPGATRQKKSEKTTESQLRVNQRKAAVEMTILMNANFRPGDYHVTLTYKREERPEDVQKAKEDRSAFLDRLRRRMNKEGKPFKYVLVTEVGKRGALHHHIVMNQVPTEWIRTAWKKGRIDVRPLDDTGQYSRLAEYFAKYKIQFQRMGGEGRAWTRSTNLYRPETKKRIIRNRGYFREEPRVKKGYWLDKETVHAGVSELTGWNFLRYILVENDGRRGSQ